MAKDNFDQAIERLYSLTVLLYGGYYEPKSDRDKELADEIIDIWMKHCVSHKGKFAGIFDPKNHHLFTAEAGLKAFAHIKIDKE